MANNEDRPGGCGCLGLIFGLGLMSLLTGGGAGPRRPEWYPDDMVPPWEPMPPPELLDEMDEDQEAEWLESDE